MIEVICLFDVLCKETCDCVWFGGNVAILASTYLTLQLKYTRCLRFSSNPNKELNLYSLFQIPNLLMWETHPVAGAHTSASLEEMSHRLCTQSDAWCDRSNMRDELWCTLTQTKTNMQSGVIQSSLLCCSVCGVPAEVSVRQKQGPVCVCAKEQGNVPRKFWVTTSKGAFRDTRETKRQSGGIECHIWMWLSCIVL